MIWNSEVYLNVSLPNKRSSSALRGRGETSRSTAKMQTRAREGKRKERRKNPSADTCSVRSSDLRMMAREFERHFVQLEVCGKFPPAPDRDEVALSEDTVAPSQRREPKHRKWSKQKLMSITTHTCLTRDDTE